MCMRFILIDQYVNKTVLIKEPQIEIQSIIHLCKIEIVKPNKIMF